MLRPKDPSNPEIQATDLRVRTREILEQVRWKGTIYTVTNFGQPVAVLVPLEVYRQWREQSGGGPIAGNGSTSGETRLAHPSAATK